MKVSMTLSLDEAARLIGVGKDTVKEWVSRPKETRLPTVQIGTRNKRVITSEIEPFLKEESKRNDAAASTI